MRTALMISIAVFLTSHAAFCEVLSVDPEATPKPIKITVEGLPDSKPTSLTTMKDVFFKNELFKPVPTQVPVSDIKKMADGNVLESEIIDAIISKLSDVEVELGRQKVINLCLGSCIAVLAALLLVFLFRRKK
jgi:hypothetical protein